MNHKFQLRALLLAVYSLFGWIIFSRYFEQRNSIEPAYSDGYRFEYGKLSRNLPDCIIIGVKKGGTRALLEYINMHADVEISLQEVHFFNVESQYLKGYNWYRSRMPLVLDGQLSVEKSPNYFLSSVTPRRIFSMNNNVKLILAVREPVERLLSDFSQSVSKKLIANVTFEDLAFQDRNHTVVNIGWRPICASNYASQMKNWLEVFPREQILVIDSSALTSDPATQMQRVEKFLGLKPFYTRDNFYFNPAKGFYCFRRNASVPGQCLEGNKGRQRKTVDANTVSRLRKHFAASNEMFWKQIGENFNWPQK